MDRRRAAAALADLLPPTPAWNYPLLDEAAGCTVVVKHENAQPIGVFKARGGLAMLSAVGEAVKGLPRLISASTGNHAQSIAFAGRHFGVPVSIVMPSNAPENKIAAVQALGAEVVRYGTCMADAVAHAAALASEHGWRYVRVDEPEIIHGHATLTWELLHSHPDLEAIYVPVGSGTSAAGACVVRDELAPSCRVIAVQSAQSPAGYESWRAGEVLTRPGSTRASGLATEMGFELPQSILRKRLDNFILVDDDALDAARGLLATHAHTLAESAGAAGLAGLLADESRPQRCAVVLSGGNADAREIASLG